MRPLRIAYGNEGKVEVQREVARIREEIRNLDPWDLEGGVDVVFKDYPMLFDGKNVAFIVDEPNQRCPLCSASPTEMSIPNGEFKVEVESGLLLLQLHKSPCGCEAHGVLFRHRGHARYQEMVY